ncbi:DedA family protein [Cryobacterium adonitolivorans]|uniref:DedA family protein n=1 Tax=Cryobacterium adonitolivorans TaxID=1259189 RepID=A0A4R8W3G3_9MICO|nr:DedA family protein [Cryobacterium adonitolivorans]TFC01687.1 DedA family protein [Cryobacterium adonitolivorans]
MPAFDALNDLVLALAGSAWVYPVVFAFVVIDGFFPPLPSETVVVALGALAVSAGTPNLGWLVAVVAMGAVLGDSIAYLIGRRIGLTRFRWQRRPGAVRIADKARAALLSRPASLLLTARYIPVGRVAVNMTAGATGFPLRRFAPLAALGGLGWAGYSVLVGMLAGAWLRNNPLLGALLAVAAALLLGVFIDAIVLRAVRRRADRRAGIVTRKAAPAPTSPRKRLHREVGEVEAG